MPVIHEGAKHPLDNGLNRLHVFVDSDYAGDETRKSTYGRVIMMNGGPIAWSSTLGKTVAMSTASIDSIISSCTIWLYIALGFL